jgi:hypothetical protein
LWGFFTLAVNLGYGVNAESNLFGFTTTANSFTFGIGRGQTGVKLSVAFPIIFVYQEETKVIVKEWL